MDTISAYTKREKQKLHMDIHNIGQTITYLDGDTVKYTSITKTTNSQNANVL